MSAKLAAADAPECDRVPPGSVKGRAAVKNALGEPARVRTDDDDFVATSQESGSLPHDPFDTAPSGASGK